MMVGCDWSVTMRFCLRIFLVLYLIVIVFLFWILALSKDPFATIPAAAVTLPWSVLIWGVLPDSWTQDNWPLALTIFAVSGAINIAILWGIAEWAGKVAESESAAPSEAETGREVPRHSQKSAGGEDSREW